ncbi:MAG TPA: sugar phosphate isomerase/epimerase family protein [Anaerolineales bacterium]|nr:sugar phosphate isomerase/epimerase family protein [Anaerolineales bacterium]
MVQLAAFPKCYLDNIIVHKSMTLFDWIEQAGQLGVDGLEMYSLFFEEQGDGYLDEVRKECEELGLALPMMCFSPDFTHPDLKNRIEELAKQKKAIDLTAKLGGLFCRTLSGQNRPGLDRKKTVRWCVEMIREAVAYAEEKGVIINMENHYKDGYWEYPEFALKSEVFLEIIEQIDSPHFGINFDPSNTIVAGEDPIELLKKIKSRVVTMHASDRYLRGRSIEDLRKIEMDPLHGYAKSIQHGIVGRGLNDYDAIFRILKDAGFDGWISIEDGLNGMEELRQSAEFLRDKINQYFGS